MLGSDVVWLDAAHAAVGLAGAQAQIESRVEEVEEDARAQGLGLTVEELVGAVALLALAGLASWQWLQRRRAKK